MNEGELLQGRVAVQEPITVDGVDLSVGQDKTVHIVAEHHGERLSLSFAHPVCLPPAVACVEESCARTAAFVISQDGQTWETCGKHLSSRVLEQCRVEPIGGGLAQSFERVDDMAKLVGLEEFPRLARVRDAEGLSPGRARGRTTRYALLALARVEQGQSTTIVVEKAVTQHHLRRRILAFAGKLGVDAALVWGLVRVERPDTASHTGSEPVLWDIR